MTVVAGCISNVPEATGPAGELEGQTNLGPVSLVHNNVNISIDPRIELLSIVQYLSSYRSHPAMTKLDSPYTKDIEEYFGDFLEHPAVNQVGMLAPKGFSWHVPPGLMLYLSLDLELGADTEIPSDMLHAFLSGMKFKDLAILLKDFSEKSNFPYFYTQNLEKYRGFVQQSVETMGSVDFITELHEYYGMEYRSFNIILAPLYSGGYGVWIDDKDQIDVYSIIGPWEVDNELLLSFGSFNSFKALQRHEFSHSFVNRITDMYWDDAKKLSRNLYTPLSSKMQKMGYGSWYGCLNEHIVRAVTTRLAYRESIKQGDWWLDYELRQGFDYVGILQEKLVEYETNRDVYPDFISFYPELLRTLEEIEP